MPFRKVTAALAALSLTAAPVLAQSAAPAAPAPASEEVSGESALVGTNRYLGMVVGAAILAIFIYILVNANEDDDDDDDDDDGNGGNVPTSP